MSVSINEPEMILVKCGTFIMGASDEQVREFACLRNDAAPAHQVTLTKDYYIGKYPVTQNLWTQVMGTNPSFNTGDDFPVTNVSWNDIVKEFLPRLNKMTGKKYRLPTEAEWEYAARGGKESKGYKYSGSDFIDDVAWCLENSGAQIQPIGKTRMKGNELGICDMSGNVWEWIYDWYGAYSVDSKNDPIYSEIGTYRVVRGGSWDCGKEHCLVFMRNKYEPIGIRLDSIGFRLAMSS